MTRVQPDKMPNCEMARVILHWTAGAYNASALDREHYHVLIEGDGSIVYGIHAIDANAKPAREPRASHTRNCNTGSIGVAVCCMKDAKERPFSAGPFPMTVEQWTVAAEVVAELCARYAIAVTPKTVLAHGEVQATLKIEQLGKWDPMVQPWSPSTPRQQVMDQFRASVRDHMTRPARPSLPPAAARTGAAGATSLPAGFTLQKQEWLGDSAVLLMHGIGNAAPGDYVDVAEAVKSALGPRTAVYSLFYDVFNDWFSAKSDAKALIGRLTSAIRSNDSDVPDTIAEFVGDVIWPLFIDASRTAIKRAYLAQMHQMVEDGMRSTGKVPGQLRFSIICHSLGCFHTYELLHAMAGDPTLKLRPGTEGVRFKSVVFMASPVQLIRTVVQAVGGLVPGELATLLAAGLRIPSEEVLRRNIKSVERWVSVTGDLDPIGGHFLRRKADWAYMDISEPPNTISIVDAQTLIGSGDDRADLLALLREAVSEGQATSIRPNNPHDWLAYIQRHQEDLKTWSA
jgi:hypothetical protein